MSTLIDPLKVTTQDLHRFWFAISTEQQWYNVINECRQLFPNNWRGMSKVRKKLSARWAPNAIMVWFEVPDQGFSTWISVKYGLQVQSDSVHKAAK